MDINRKQVKVFVALNDNEERMRCILILERFHWNHIQKVIIHSN